MALVQAPTPNRAEAPSSAGTASRRAAVLTAALLAAGVAADAAVEPAPMSLAAFAALDQPRPTSEVRYGPAPVQAADVFLPAGAGPFPVAILIHGGCWRDLPGAGREQLRAIAADLAGRGIAVWNLGYRRADEPGGGYPGTYLDVGTGLDRLRAEAGRLNLDLARTALVGHSAGGHLALWAASRPGLAPDSPLRGPDPFAPGAVISLAGIPDLRAFGPFVPVHCGPGIFERLTGAAAPEDARFGEISPAEMPAPAAPVVMVSGVLDRLVPPYVADDHRRAMRARSATDLESVDIPGAGHFDLVAPGTPAWSVVRSAIARALTVPGTITTD